MACIHLRWLRSYLADSLRLSCSLYAVEVLGWVGGIIIGKTSFIQARCLIFRHPTHPVFAWEKDAPWTNTDTEQVIGRVKMCRRTVRGYNLLN